MRRCALLVLGSLLLTGQAEAISRYNSTSMSCGEVQARIDAEGAAIMRYRSQRNPSLTLYDRYVANDSFCPIQQEAVYDYIPAADTSSCPVLVCEEIDPDDFFDWEWRLLRRR